MKTIFNPAYLIDAYKIDHRRMYPEGTQRIYSNLTPRTSRIPGVDKVVLFGLQAFCTKVLEDMFGEWFAADEDAVCAAYEARTAAVLGPNEVGVDHIRALHRLGYLPLRFCAVPEGTEVPLRVPMFTVENTLSEFFWLTNYIETVLSAETWLPCTSATLALRLRRLLDEAAARTSDAPAFVDWQGHDFSFRGLSSVESAAASGAAHLLSFAGTDSLCALDPTAPVGSPARAGVIQLLWNVFGGVTNSKGYRELDPHIGAIYGDSISYERASAIIERLGAAGFASTNIVFGVGSFTYQYNTRDTFGFAMKATWAEVNGVGRDLYKDPKTDSGTKRSARGRLAVVRDALGELVLIERASAAQEAASLLRPVWENGKAVVVQTWDEIVARVSARAV